MDIGFWLEFFGQWLVARKAKNWPLTRARVENASVTVIPTKKTRWAIEVAYAYDVNGETYGNTERRFYLDPEEPRALESSLKKTGMSVHYDPARPAHSFMDLLQSAR